MNTTRSSLWRHSFKQQSCLSRLQNSLTVLFLPVLLITAAADYLQYFNVGLADYLVGKHCEIDKNKQFSDELPTL